MAAFNGTVTKLMKHTVSSVLTLILLNLQFVYEKGLNVCS